MPQGVIEGGWSYVIAAYTFTGISLLIYAVIMRLRMKNAHRDQENT